MNRIIKRMALPVGAAIVLGSSGFAFMASNNVDTSYAGQGHNTVAGYNVSDVHYVTAQDNGVPRWIEQVQFSLDHAADPANLAAVITDNTGGGGKQYYNQCTAMTGSGYRYSCGLANQDNVAQVATAADLQVTAAQ